MFFPFHFVSRVLNTLFICVNYYASMMSAVAYFCQIKYTGVRSRHGKRFERCSGTFRASFQNMKNVELKHNS